MYFRVCIYFRVTMFQVLFFWPVSKHCEAFPPLLYCLCVCRSSLCIFVCVYISVSLCFRCFFFGQCLNIVKHFHPCYIVCVCAEVVYVFSCVYVVSESPIHQNWKFWWIYLSEFQILMDWSFWYDTYIYLYLYVPGARPVSGHCKAGWPATDSVHRVWSVENVKTKSSP